MNLETLHQYLGQLLSAGVDPKTPVTCMTDGWPCELTDAAMLEGKYSGDPSPKMSAFSPCEGTTFVLIPITEDVSDLLNNNSHQAHALPVEPPYPD